MQSNGLPHPSPDAISHHGLTERAGYGEPDPRTVLLRLPDHECGEQRAREFRARVVNPSEVFGSKQTNTFRKTSDRGLPLGADRQFVAAAGAPAGQHGPAVLGSHAGAEPVRFRAAAVIRLKGAFRHGSSSYQYSREWPRFLKPESAHRKIGPPGSIPRRNPFRAIDHQRLDGRPPRLQFQSELFLNGRE